MLWAISLECWINLHECLFITLISLIDALSACDSTKSHSLLCKWQRTIKRLCAQPLTYFMMLNCLWQAQKLHSYDDHRRGLFNCFKEFAERLINEMITATVLWYKLFRDCEIEPPIKWMAVWSSVTMHKSALSAITLKHFLSPHWVIIERIIDLWDPDSGSQSIAIQGRFFPSFPLHYSVLPLLPLEPSPGGGPQS